jgi:hypothetical protein
VLGQVVGVFTAEQLSNLEKEKPERFQIGPFKTIIQSFKLVHYARRDLSVILGLIQYFPIR